MASTKRLLPTGDRGCGAETAIGAGPPESGSTGWKNNLAP